MPTQLRWWWVRATVGAAWSLPAFLGIALLLRLPAVLLADGYEYVDQQFQYVDPAWHLATGDGFHATWEWRAGIRSPVYPTFLAGVFRLLLALGLEEPLTLMRAVRGVHALLSLLPLWLFWLVLVRWRPVALPRLPLLLFAGSGLVLTIGVQPSAPAMGATLAIAAVLAFHGPRWFPALGGLLLGLAFCCRFQEALFGPAVVLVGLAQRRWRAVATFALGCVPGILLQGLGDLANLGAFLEGPLRYFRINVLDGVSSLVGTRPWYFYPVAVLPGLALLPPWFGIAWRRLRAGGVVLPAALAAGVLHLLAHSFVARKALRFEYGALGLLLAVIAAGVGAVPTGRRAGSHRLALVVVHGLLFVWASFWFGHQGAVGAADALRREPEFTGELWVVGAEAPVTGGAYYLRRPELSLWRVEPVELRERLEQADGRAVFVLTVGEPLAADIAVACALEPYGEWRGMFDLRRRDRRYVYRRAR